MLRLPKLTRQRASVSVVPSPRTLPSPCACAKTVLGMSIKSARSCRWSQNSSASDDDKGDDELDNESDESDDDKKDNESDDCRASHACGLRAGKATLPATGGRHRNLSPCFTTKNSSAAATPSRRISRFRAKMCSRSFSAYDMEE